jgi:cytidylate kinase
MVTPRLSHSSLGQVAERQMRMWAIGLDVLEKLHDEEAHRTPPSAGHPSVCISRETGALGEEVAQQLADKLGWQLLDRELIHYIAERGHLSETMLQYVDERRWNWLMEVFGSQIQQKTTNQAGYVMRLGQVLLTAIQHGPAVIVGRGAQFLFPSDRTLAVRIVAPRQVRMQNVMAQQGLKEHEAASSLDKTDANRDDFVQRFFHKDARDPHLYDLIVNTGTIPPEEAAELVATECRRRFVETASRAVATTAV